MGSSLTFKGDIAEGRVQSLDKMRVIAVATPQDKLGVGTIPLPEDRQTSKRAMYGRCPRCKRNLTFLGSVRVQPCIRPHMMVSPSRADVGRP